jgi:DNA/RNA endonuclease YhcR with UshA esterase domain
VNGNGTLTAVFSPLATQTAEQDADRVRETTVWEGECASIWGCVQAGADRSRS